MTAAAPSTTSTSVAANPLPSVTASAGPTPVTIPSASPSPTSDTPTDLTLTLGPVTGGSLQNLLGVNAGPIPGDQGSVDASVAYHTLGVQSIRTHDFFGPFDMRTIYPNHNADPTLQSSYNFVTSDDAYRALAAGGFRIYLRLGDSAGAINPPQTPEARANWVQAALNVVRHYQSGQWNGFFANLTHVEIWNEPDSPLFWPLSDQEFYQLYVDTAKAVKSAFPDLQVGGPGLTQAAFQFPDGEAWLERFLDQVQAQQAPLDFLSFHLYADDPARFTTAARYYRGRLDARGLQSVRLQCTEFNAEEDLRGGPMGAPLATEAWIRLQDQGLDQAYFYRGVDRGPADPKGYGMLQWNANPRPTGLSFGLWSEMSTYPTRRSLTGTGSLTALAGQNSAGRVAILLTNPSATDLTVHLAGQAGSATRKRIVTSQVAVLTDQVDLGAFTVEAGSVALLLLP